MSRSLAKNYPLVLHFSQTFAGESRNQKRPSGDLARLLQKMEGHFLHRILANAIATFQPRIHSKSSMKQFLFLRKILIRFKRYAGLYPRRISACLDNGASHETQRTKQRYAAAAMGHDMVLEDHGYFSLRAAYHKQMGSCDLDTTEVRQVFLEKSSPYTFQGRKGRRWEGFFWDEKLELNTYVTHMAIVEMLAISRG